MSPCPRHYIDVNVSLEVMQDLNFVTSCDGSNTKTACNAGTYNSNTGSTSSADCTACASNEISSAGAASCELCPAGYSCSSQSSTSACSSQEYSLLGEASCTTCPSGSICPTTNQAPSVRYIYRSVLGVALLCTACSSNSTWLIANQAPLVRYSYRSVLDVAL